MSDRAPATPSSETTVTETDAVAVRIPGVLRPLTDGVDEVEVLAGAVEDVLHALVARYPGLRRHLLTDHGTVRDHVNLFVDEADVRYLDGLGTRLRPGQVVTIVPSIAGG